MERTQTFMNKHINLSLSILVISKIVTCELWYDVKPRYKEKSKLCCMDTDSFIVCVNAKDVSVDSAKDVKI